MSNPRLLELRRSRRPQSRVRVQYYIVLGVREGPKGRVSHSTVLPETWVNLNRREPYDPVAKKKKKR